MRIVATAAMPVVRRPRRVIAAVARVEILDGGGGGRLHVLEHARTLGRRLEGTIRVVTWEGGSTPSSPSATSGVA